MLDVQCDLLVMNSVKCPDKKANFSRYARQNRALSAHCMELSKLMALENSCFAVILAAEVDTVLAVAS